MIPTTGRIVHYTLSQYDVEQIKKVRAGAGSATQCGNAPHEGDVLPMLIVRPWGDTEGSAVNGQVFLDGNDSYWATSRNQGDGPGYWSEPPRV